MMLTKGLLPAIGIGCLVLMTLPTAGCGVSGNGLGNRSDAAADVSKQALDTRTEVALDADLSRLEVKPETNSSPLDGVPDEAAPRDARDARLDQVSSPDTALVDTSIASEVQTAPEVPAVPDAPSVSDGNQDSLPPQMDGPATVPVDGSDVPVHDTAPLDSPRLDLARVDQATDLPVIADVPRDLAPPDLAPQPTSNWVIDNTTSIGGFTPTVTGTPTVTAMDAGTAVCFDGTKDALFLNTNPILGMQRFTIETLVYPELTGISEPRLIHVGDAGNNSPRLIIQMRSDATGTWHALIGFEWAGVTTNIEDTTFPHPSNQWYWLAVTYDGQTARVYVNDVLENSSDLAFGPMTAGTTSLGARQSGQYYFPGCMRDVEFFNSALPASQLKKP
jgi:hypothetical protein